MGRGVHFALVVIADADARRRRALRDVVGGLEEIDAVIEAGTALEAARHARDASLVLLDCSLPDADVVDAIALVRRAAGGVPVIAVSAGTDPELVRRALDAGAMSFLSHTGPALTVGDAVSGALRGRGMLDPDLIRPVLHRYGELVQAARTRDRAVIESLAAAVEAKDTVTSRHLRAVSHLALRLAELVEPSLARSDHFLFGCLLHDVGKIGVPERILAKPGPLTEDEWVVMRTHPSVGADVIRPLGLDQVVENVVLHHHERWDGTGYPNGHAGDAIPLEARIFAVCDAMEAMTAPRPYRGPLAAATAYGRVLAAAGRQFDPGVVHALERGVRDRSLGLPRHLTPAAR
jgi:putative two-component system response regulator